MEKSTVVWIIVLISAIGIFWLCFGTEALRWIGGPVILPFGK